MIITFANKKLKKCANNDRVALKEMGKKRFEFFKKRMTALLIAENLEELRRIYRGTGTNLQETGKDNGPALLTSHTGLFLNR
jgi:hypothetical protein